MLHTDCLDSARVPAPGAVVMLLVDGCHSAHQDPADDPMMKQLFGVNLHTALRCEESGEVITVSTCWLNVGDTMCVCVCTYLQYFCTPQKSKQHTKHMILHTCGWWSRLHHQVPPHRRTRRCLPSSATSPST